MIGPCRSRITVKANTPENRMATTIAVKPGGGIFPVAGGFWYRHARNKYRIPLSVRSPNVLPGSRLEVIFLNIIEVFIFKGFPLGKSGRRWDYYLNARQGL